MHAVAQSRWLALGFIGRRTCQWQTPIPGEKTLWILLQEEVQFHSFLGVCFLQGSALAYFKSAWNIVDFLSTALLFACVIVWWDFALRNALPFDINLRYISIPCSPAVQSAPPAPPHLPFT